MYIYNYIQYIYIYNIYIHITVAVALKHMTKLETHTHTHARTMDNRSCVSNHSLASSGLRQVSVAEEFDQVKGLTGSTAMKQQNHAKPMSHEAFHAMPSAREQDCQNMAEPCGTVPPLCMVTPYQGCPKVFNWFVQ